MKRFLFGLFVALALVSNIGYAATSTTAVTGASNADLAGKPITDIYDTIQISGTYTGFQFQVQASVDGTNFFNVSVTDLSAGSIISGGTTISPASNAVAAWKVTCDGYQTVRVKATQVSTGTVTVLHNSYSQVGVPSVAINSSGLSASPINGSVLSSSATGGVGYQAGAGGAVTQLTSRTTGVTLNTVTGSITLFSAAGSATPASFTVTNSSVGANDTVIVSCKTATDLYEIFVTTVAAGSFKITSFTTGGTTTEQPIFQFTVIKGAVN